MQTQTKAAFTPGPWSWKWTADNKTLMQLVTDMPNPRLNDPVVFAVREDWIRHIASHPEGQANARLIAKAPELYALLVSVRDQGYTSDPAGALNRMKDAAAKLLAEIEGA